MRTSHHVTFADSRDLSFIPAESVDLVVTSPPYPFIAMWNEVFESFTPEVGEARRAGECGRAFELMHRDLDAVWREVYRVLKPGSIACINIGDATRTEEGVFQLFTNHARILTFCLSLGLLALPDIIWRKQTNAPNKFMGSGMLPPGAYVTFEHEFILILRKGDKRRFDSETERLNRERSAFFWEERNVWFSDVWDFKGTRQVLNNDAGRERSGSFPFELAHRLVNMFSVKGDLVLDPFLGSGTTMAAAMACGRNSAGVEIEPAFGNIVDAAFLHIVPALNQAVRSRLAGHLAFVDDREAQHKPLKHRSTQYGFPVMTRQEREILINYVRSTEKTGPGSFEVDYFDEPLLDPNGLPF